MTRNYLCLAVMMTLFAGVLPAAEKNPADYPLGLTIFTQHYVTHYHNGVADFYEGSGKANLHDGDKIQAFDYTYDCYYNFMATSHGQYIPAKWNKKNDRLEMLLQEVGKGKYHECEMKVTMLDAVYKRNSAGMLAAIPMAQYLAMQAEDHPVDSNPGDYPLRVMLVQTNWHQTLTGHSGTGSGNAKDGDKVLGFDFTADCLNSMPVTHPGNMYRAKWVQPGSVLELFAHAVGDNSQSTVCDLHTTMQSFVYIRYASGQLQTYTPAQYNHWVAMQKANPEALPDPQILERPFPE